MTTTLQLANRPLLRAEDDLKRYVGLPWSGGDPEVWAYAYYDVIEDANPDHVLPLDVVAVAALHPPLKRSDLTWFVEHRAVLQEFLASVEDRDLADADPSSLDPLPAIAATGVDLSLLSKVLHRKRPKLIPLLDRRLTDWYRFRVQGRGASAWPEVTRALAQDLTENRQSLDTLRQIVPLSQLRIADIAIWMESSR